MLQEGMNPRDIKGGIWVLNANAPSWQFLTIGTAASWSPRGDQLAVIDNSYSHMLVKIIDLNTLETRVIREIENPNADLVNDLDWSPEGDYLALVMAGESSDGYRRDYLYLLSADGATLSIFSTPYLEEMEWSIRSPQWLPGGDWLAFILVYSGAEGFPAVAPRTGECVMSLFPEQVRASRLDISPDGKSVVLENGGDIYIVDLEKAVGPQVLPGALECP